MMKFLKKLIYKGIYYKKKVVVVIINILKKYIFLLYCFFLIDPVKAISMFRLILTVYMYLYVNIFENVDISISLSDSNRSTPPILTDGSSLPDSSLPSPSEYQSSIGSEGRSNSAGSSYYDPDNDYGLYEESSISSRELGTRNASPVHNTHYHAAKLSEDILNINAHVAGTDLSVELSRALTITGVPGPKDLVAHVSGEIVVIKQAATLPQDEQREILLSVKKALFNIDMATRNSEIAEAGHSNGNTSGSEKSYTNSQGVRVRERISRADFEEARSVVSECRRTLYRNR